VQDIIRIPGPGAEEEVGFEDAPAPTYLRNNVYQEEEEPKQEERGKTKPKAINDHKNEESKNVKTIKFISNDNYDQGNR